MNIAVIDMRINTFHLLIAKVENNDCDVIYKERVVVKIGEKGIKQGEIVPETWVHVMNTLKAFKRIISRIQITKAHVAKIFATVTNAVRNASNRQGLEIEIKKQTGIEAKVISGKREAELILHGTKKH